MLVCEQLEFKNEQCTLVVLPSEIPSEIKEWFTDYFNEVVSPDLSEINMEKLSQAEQKTFLKSYVLQAALLCE